MVLRHGAFTILRPRRNSCFAVTLVLCADGSINYNMSPLHSHLLLAASRGVRYCILSQPSRWSRAPADAAVFRRRRRPLSHPRRESGAHQVEPASTGRPGALLRLWLAWMHMTSKRGAHRRRAAPARARFRIFTVYPGRPFPCVATSTRPAAFCTRPRPAISAAPSQAPAQAEPADSRRGFAGLLTTVLRLSTPNRWKLSRASTSF